MASVGQLTPEAVNSLIARTFKTNGLTLCRSDAEGEQRWCHTESHFFHISIKENHSDREEREREERGDGKERRRKKRIRSLTSERKRRGSTQSKDSDSALDMILSIAVKIL